MSSGHSVYYDYRLLDKTIDDHILSTTTSVRWYSGILPHLKLLGGRLGRSWLGKGIDPGILGALTRRWRDGPKTTRSLAISQNPPDI